jgi:hypothetical protein
MIPSELAARMSQGEFVEMLAYERIKKEREEEANG